MTPRMVSVLGVKTPPKVPNFVGPFCGEDADATRAQRTTNTACKKFGKLFPAPNVHRAGRGVLLGKEKSRPVIGASS